MASNRIATSKTVATAGDATPPLVLQKGDRFTLSIANAGSGAAFAVERNPDGIAWRAIKTYSADAEEDGIASENMEVRLRCTTYVAPSSGSTVLRIGA